LKHFSALHRYGTSTPKCVAGIVLDQAGRPSQQITYGKLLSRSNKVAFMLLNKTISGGKDNSKVPMCKPGDRVALIYPNTEPLAFLSAFYGCIVAGVVPVPVEVPITKRDAGIQQLGFLLGSCGVKVALTSESCYKGLPKSATSSSLASRSAPSGSSSLSGASQEIVDLKAWPRLYWMITEHLGKPSRDWTAPPRVADESIAYIEYSCDRDGAVKGVCISRQAMRTSSGSGSSGRGILSMAALSHSVVRVDKENSLTSLTLQDAGQVIPSGSVVVIKQTGPARLCRADELGEICLCSNSTGHAYWGLEGVEPLGADDRPLGPRRYVRSGLIGFMGPDGLVFVVGRRTAQLSVSGRQHSADDIIATVLAVEPMRFVYRGRIAVFSVSVLRDERIVIVAEQKPGASEEDAFTWMSRVLQAVDAIHQVGIYCLALVPSNQLPKTPLGGIHVSETRQRFEAGELHPSTLLMCPHSCVINLPKPREVQPDIGPASMLLGNLVQGVRIAGAQGRSLGAEDDMNLLEILRSRASSSPDHRLFTLVTSKSPEQDTATCASLLKRAERIGAFLVERGRLNAGDHVALIFPPGIDFIAAFYGCLVAGVVPVCIRAPSSVLLQTTLPSVRMIVDSKEAAHRVDSKAWPMILDIEDSPASWKRKTNAELSDPLPSDACYLDFSVSTTGQLVGVIVSIGGALSMCKSLKVTCELYPSRHVALCLDPYSGLGFALWCLSSIYSGHHTILIPPTEVEANPSLWLSTVSALKARDTFTTYGILGLCIQELATQVPSLKEKGVNLSCVRTCVVVAEERPRANLVNAFSRLFAPLGLSSRAVSTSFGCRVNAAICMQVGI
uniref:Disco-interacting protein 2 (inferred by orthology to a D. melanogaster protein) n=1 Tax=Nippostrongylus brasiliensis TaxID=27835 RepID=A0A0N4YVX4_NIPBR